MMFQESDIESYLFHENGLSGGIPVYSMFPGTTHSGGGMAGINKNFVIPSGVIIEEYASEECMRSTNTGDKWICKKEVGYVGNDMFEQFLEKFKHGPRSRPL